MYVWKTLTNEALSPLVLQHLRQSEKQGLGPRPPLPRPRWAHGPRVISTLQGKQTGSCSELHQPPGNCNTLPGTPPLATSIQLREAAKAGSWDLDLDQVCRTLSPGPLHAESQILQAKWASPQNSVLQMDILCPHTAQVSFRENGKPRSAEPLSARKGTSSLPRSQTGPITRYQWQQLTPASPGLLVNRGKRRPQATPWRRSAAGPAWDPSPCG